MEKRRLSKSERRLAQFETRKDKYRNMTKAELILKVQELQAACNLKDSILRTYENKRNKLKRMLRHMQNGN